MKYGRLQAAFYGIIVLSMLVIGCISHKSPPQPVKFYQLDYPPPEASFESTPLPYIIRVDPFQPSDLYNSKPIIYREGRYGTSKYTYHRWISAPDQMVSRFLARDLRHADIVNAVFLDGGEAATHRLVGSLEAFYENDQQRQWEAVAAVSITLIDTGYRNIAEQICFQKTYSVNKPCPENTPAGFVEAMSLSMNEISRMIISDIYNELLMAEGKSQRND